MKQINRREFIKYSASSTAFVLGMSLSVTGQASSAGRDEPESEKKAGFSPNLWLGIDRDNRCTITLPESEMGQGVYTGLATLIAEELDLDWSQIVVERATSSRVYGYQLTGGSTSIRDGWVMFRKAGAVARYMLVQAAAKIWNVKMSDCYSDQGAVFLKGGNKKFKYSELITQANQLAIPENVQLKESAEYKLTGRNNSRIDSVEKVNGKAVFGIDVQLPGMLVATTVHPPVFGATVGRVDDSQAKKIAGVLKTIKIDNAVAVVAKDYWSASQASKALKIEWLYDNERLDDKKIKQKLHSALENAGVVAQQLGEIETGDVAENNQISAQYSVPLQAHVTMEPMNCTVHIHDGLCEVWAPTQSPTAAKEAAEEYYSNLVSRAWGKVKSIFSETARDTVLVHTTYSGGGFGRRLKQDFVAEAVQIATHFAQPVKLIWSREEDIQHDRYRPLALCKLQAQVGEDGYPKSILHELASPSIRESLNPGYIDIKNGMDSSAVEGARHLPYEIENHKVVYKYVELPVPLGYWRSVGSSINAFCIESFIDELAIKAKKDPYQYREELLQFNPRILATLKAVAKLSGWKQDADAFYGIACHSSYGSHVSSVAKIRRINNKFKLSNMYSVIDCGQNVNPGVVKAQLEGSIIFGMSALFSEINIVDGRVEQSNYHDFPVVRYDQAPDISCEIIQSTEDPGGAGEPGVPPTIPAILNAVFAATGERIRDLPYRSSL
ncbi:MAG TPA: xanthine dehydrogenase family protein molybdopterin-binding subunit [Gammaproteobacteria bacterium]|nr:xanthine dehydrogenase family protein molybdopterin-binding subunit [Gammaproteobacteria bacterium]